MAQAESKLSRRIMDALKRQGAFCFKIHGSALMMAGLPDIVCCYNGLFICFETKMPTKRNNVSIRQNYVHGLIRKAGGVVTVICSAEEALDALERATQDPVWDGEK